MPPAKSRNELPSTSCSTVPSARAMKTGAVDCAPRGTAFWRLSAHRSESGPGISVWSWIVLTSSYPQNLSAGPRRLSPKPLASSLTCSQNCGRLVRNEVSDLAEYRLFSSPMERWQRWKAPKTSGTGEGQPSCTSHRVLQGILLASVLGSKARNGLIPPEPASPQFPWPVRASARRTALQHQLEGQSGTILLISLTASYQ